MKRLFYRLYLGLLMLAMVSMACSMSGQEKGTEDSPAAQASGGSVGASVGETKPTSATSEGGGEQKPTEGWTIYSNANDAHGITFYDGKLWVSTRGGVVAWDVQSGKPTKYTTLDGLRHISTYDVVFCALPQPRIVVATETGLSFFDLASGKWDRQQITPEESKVGVSKIDKLYCDAANGRLLIGQGGLGILDTNTSQFKRITQKEGMEWESASDIAVVGKDIWVASGYKYATLISGDKAQSFDSSKGMPADTVYSVIAGQDGKAWFGTSQGLMSYAKGKWEDFGRERVANIPAPVMDIARTGDGKLWIGSHSTVCLFDPASATCVKSAKNPLSASIFGVTVDDKDNPYFATAQGILKLDGDTLKPMVIETDYLASNFVTDIAMDKSGALWVSTEDGLNRFDAAKPAEKWELFKYDSAKKDSSPCGTYFTGIFPQADGSLWFVPSGSGPCKYDGSTWMRFTQEQGLKSNSVTSIVTAQDGKTWFGTAEGVTVWDGSNATQLSESEGLPHKSVRGLLADGDMVWISTVKGLARFQNGKLETMIGKNKGGGEVNIKDMVKEPSGTLLLGTENGLLRFDGSQVSEVLKPVPAKDYFGFAANTSISALALGTNGHIWAGTYTGVYHFDGSNWEHLSPATGLPATNINAVYLDKDGTLWVGGGYTNSGGALARLPAGGLTGAGQAEEKPQPSVEETKPPAEKPKPTAKPTTQVKPTRVPPAAQGGAFKTDAETGLPILDDAEITSATKDETLNYLTNADLKTVREFYLTNLPKIGWLLDVDEKGKCRDNDRCMGWHSDYKDPKTTTFFFISGKKAYMTVNYLQEGKRMHVVISINMDYKK